ncbi:MAG: hypothetical protein ABIH52_02555 [Candidatus Aenigmatarchaeota archaeon]|nr:hypothetical protein [Nanoarchaeota archaeon]
MQPDQVKLPDKSGTLKFIVIEYAGQAYLRFSGILHGFHSDLVESFLQELQQLGITCDEDKLHVGGGKVDVDVENKHMKFYGQSSVYGRFDDNKLRSLMQGVDYEYEIG